jgi:trigger factor
MQVQKTSSTSTSAVVKVSLDSQELGTVKQHVLTKHFAKNVNVAGFRTGKAPLELLEKNVDQQRLASEVLEHAVNDYYVSAMQQENLRPVGDPNIELKSFSPFSELTFEVKVEVVGVVSLPNYKQVILRPHKVEVTDQDIEEVLKSLQHRMAEKTDVQRPSKIGDQVWIDFSATNESGQPVKGADGKDYPLVLGNKTFIPGFEENLIGANIKDEKKFTVNFPNDYGVAALRGKKANFTTLVKNIQEVLLPALDDKFASAAGPFKTLEELKTDIRRQLTAERQQQAKVNYENELIRQITENAEVEIPKKLVDDQVISMEKDEKRNLTYQGQTWKEHLEAEKQTEEEHRQSKRGEAEHRVKAGIVLSEISVTEKLEVTPEELEIRVQVLKGQYQDQAMQAELEKPENRRDIAARLLTEKTIAKLVEYNQSS